ncbi:TonB-dependent receptor [Pedobacter aquatilis]|uniref:TonB-dependent receptor n=1 Tax=Pedobacter aquatilis TaxID=351343 RepID=UPI00292F8A97|nr:TonB-dependent receptor [Pedobacter aquatilis]
MIKKILIVLLVAFVTIHTSHAQQKLLSKVTVNGFYTTTLDAVLDSLVKKHQLKIVFDRELAEHKLISERFDDTPLNLALKILCKSAELHYWVEPDGTIYVVRTPEEVRALQRAQRIAQSTNNQSIRMITEERTDTIRKGGGKITAQHFKLSGKVIDQLSGESLPGAVVSIENTALRATTNADGFFTLIDVPADTCVLSTSYVGYLSDRLALNAVKPNQVLSIALSVARNNLEEVSIKGKKNDGIMSTDKRKVSVLQISPAKLAELPNLGEKDILRSFQLMPGVSASNESSSGAYVRGGTPDQNLVLFDGFTVYQVDHLYGFFSAFNSNAVKDVQLFKGGFSAKYGGRLSSVTEIIGKEGTKKDWNVGGDISLLSANVYLETPVKKNGSFLLALRKSYQGPLYNKIFSQFNKTSTVTAGPGGGGGFGGGGQASTTPTSYFYDLNAKYTLNLGKKDLLAWSIYQGDDDLDNSRTISIPSFLTTSSSAISPSITDKTTYGNLGSSMKWSRRWNDEVYSNTLVSYSSYHSDRDRTNTVGVTNTDGTETSVSTGTIERNRLKDWSIKSDWEYQVSNKVKFLFGGYGSAQNVIYKYSQNDTSTLIDQSKDAKTLAVYAEGEFSPWEKLQFKGGVRETYYSPTGKTYFEPRFSGTYTLTDRFTLKAATGKFYQFINRVVREDILSGSRDFWVLANGSSIPVGSANHYIAGFSYETDKYLFDVEGYYKTLNGLTEYSQRLSGNRMSSTLEEHFYNGHGYTSGVEFLAQKKAGKYTGWLSYTMAIARNQFDDYGVNYYSANQDARNEFKSVNMYKLGNWTFSATWIFATGKPYTAPIASYTIDNASGNSKTYLTISGKNTERMPAYHRLDLAATLDLIKIDNRKTGSISFSLFNVYNRTNVWYKEYTIYNNQVITTNVNYLGFTPNITLSLKWK